MNTKTTVIGGGMDVKAACFTCHIPKKDRAYVFSEWVEFTK